MLAPTVIRAPARIGSPAPALVPRPSPPPAPWSRPPPGRGSAARTGSAAPRPPATAARPPLGRASGRPRGGIATCARYRAATRNRYRRRFAQRRWRPGRRGVGQKRILLLRFALRAPLRGRPNPTGWTSFQPARVAQFSTGLDTRQGETRAASRARDSWSSSDAGARPQRVAGSPVSARRIDTVVVDPATAEQRRRTATAPLSSSTTGARTARR
jgi:hypothetical protein